MTQFGIPPQPLDHGEDLPDPDANLGLVAPLRTRWWVKSRALGASDPINASFELLQLGLSWNHQTALMPTYAYRGRQSVVVPVKNEQDNIEPLAREIAAALSSQHHVLVFARVGSGVHLARGRNGTP